MPSLSLLLACCLFSSLLHYLGWSLLAVYCYIAVIYVALDHKWMSSIWAPSRWRSNIALCRSPLVTALPAGDSRSRRHRGLSACETYCGEIGLSVGRTRGGAPRWSQTQSATSQPEAPARCTAVGAGRRHAARDAALPAGVRAAWWSVRDPAPWWRSGGLAQELRTGLHAFRLRPSGGRARTRRK